MSGLDQMKKRINHYGATIDDRLVKEKYDSFDYARWHSYQGEWITYKEDQHRVLINPSRLTEQFDTKVISAPFSAKLDEGEIFYWDRTKRYWIVTLQQHTEEAYFRATINRCDYEIEINGTHYWAVKRGPIETSTEWKQKHDIAFNDPNLSILLEIKKDSNTVDYFTRFRVVKVKLYYDDVETGEQKWTEHNWQVVATDKYSSEKTMQVYLREHYDNEMEDKKVVEPAPTPPYPQDIYIDGPAKVNPYDTALVYTVKNLDGGDFVVDSSKVKLTKIDDITCSIDIETGKAASFNLKYVVSGDVKAILNVKISSF